MALMTFAADPAYRRRGYARAALEAPDGGTRLELSSSARPDHRPGSPAAPANELGLRNVAFEVNDLQAAVDQAAADGYRR